jgi:chemotaxis signal transduction protein
MSLARATRVRTTRRGEPMILFTVASFTFAISASVVDEIRSADVLKPFTPSPWLHTPTVRFTATHHNSTVFVVEANLHFRILPSPLTRVLLLRNRPVGIAVEQTHRMIEISTLYSLSRAFTGEEREWYRGLALMGEDVIPVVNPAAFLDEGQLERLRDTLSTRAQSKGAIA